MSDHAVPRRGQAGAFALLLLATAVPLIWPHIPPIVDLPGHIGRYDVALRLAHSAALQRFWTFQWQLVGNLGVDLLVMPLASLVGVEAAAKIITIVIVLLTAGGFLALSREAHGRIMPSTLLALPLTYAYPFMYGFVNYCLGTALAFLAFALWLRLGRAGRPGLRAALFVAIAPAIWLAHAISWGVLCILCAGGEAGRLIAARERRPVRYAAAALGGLPLLAALVPALLASRAPSSSASIWFSAGGLFRWAGSVLRDRWFLFDLVSACFLYGIVALAVLRIGRLRLSPLLAGPAALMALAFVLLPQQVNGSDFFNSRLAPSALALALLAIDTRALSPRGQRFAALVGGGFLLVRLAGVTASLFLYGQSWDSSLRALDYVRRGSAVAVLAGQTCGTPRQNWASNRLQHLSGLAIVRRDAFVNSEWSLAGIQLLGVRYTAAAPLLSDPSQLVAVMSCPYSPNLTVEQALGSVKPQAFDYIWLLGIPREQWPRQSLPDGTGLRALWHDDASILFEIDHLPLAAAARPAGSMNGSLR